MDFKNMSTNCLASAQLLSIKTYLNQTIKSCERSAGRAAVNILKFLV